MALVLLALSLGLEQANPELRHAEWYLITLAIHLVHLHLYIRPSLVM